MKYFFDSKGMSQTKVAAAMRIDRAHLNQVLNGRRPINATFLGHYWITFVWPDSPYYLPDASDALNEVIGHIGQTEQGGAQ